MTSAILNADAFPASRPAASTALPAPEELDRLYRGRIHRFLLASLRDRDVAETLTQETFLRAWTARESFRGDSAPATWLTRIALNLLRDHTRTNRFRFWQQAGRTAVDAQTMAGHLAAPGTTSESALIAHEQIKLVWETVETLSERQRSVFLLRFVEELELAEIAEITGLPISTVKTHLYRALATIRSRHPRANQAASDGAATNGAAATHKEAR